MVWERVRAEGETEGGIKDYDSKALDVIHKEKTMEEFLYEKCRKNVMLVWEICLRCPQIIQRRCPLDREDQELTMRNTQKRMTAMAGVPGDR